MRILLVRQAVVPGGTVRFRAAARGLARAIGRIDVLLTSPLPGAPESARIVARALGRDAVVEPALGTDRVETLIDALTIHPRDATVALVADEPILGALLGQVLGISAGLCTLKRGGAALLDLPDGPSVTGRLAWLLPPRIL